MLAFKGELVLISDDVFSTVQEVVEDNTVVRIITAKHAGDNVLGSHYHRDTTEVFYFWSGLARLFRCPVDGLGERNGDIVQTWHNSPAGKVIISPYTAHRFELWAGTVVVQVSLPSLPKKDMFPATWLLNATYRSASDGEKGE